MKSKLVKIFFFLLALCATTLFLLNKNKIDDYLSAYNNTPNNILISNLTSNSFTVTWTTKVKDYGYVINDPATPLSKFSESMNVADKSYTHSATITDLKPESKYEFVISNGVRDWNFAQVGVSSLIDKDSTFTVLTLPQDDTTPSTPKPLLGQVNITNSGSNSQTKGSGLIVFLNLPGSSNYISTVTDSYGYWLIDASSLVISPDQSININVLSDEKAPVLKNIMFADYLDSKVTIDITKKLSYTTNILIPHTLAAEGINCNQNAPEQSVDGALNQEEYGKLMDRWTNYKGKNYARECYNDVVCRAKSTGVDPTFALLIWANESGASNYTFFSTTIQDFGINREDVPSNDFNAQITAFTGLIFKQKCKETTYWLSWASQYLNGVCDPDDKSVTGTSGREYLASMQEKWTWISSKDWPTEIKGEGTGQSCSEIGPVDPGDGEPGGGSSGSGSDGDDDSGNEPNGGSTPATGAANRCCALSAVNSNDFKGDFEEDLVSCDEFIKGKDYGNGPLDYAVEIPSISSRNACQKDYTGVCCNTSSGIKWVPQINCATDKIVIEHSDKASCNAASKTELYNFKLENGLTLVAFPFKPVDANKSPLKASGLMAAFSNLSKDYISWVARYSGGSWQMYTIDDLEGRGAGVDFELNDTEGYFIMSESLQSSQQVTLSGIASSTPTAYQLNPGWNLIRISKKDAQNASTFINSQNVSNLSYWSSQKSKFEGLSILNSKNYGTDFEIDANSGYFVKK